MKSSICSKFYLQCDVILSCLPNTAPTKSSRRSSEETAAPAKVTRSHRSSAPSELGAASPTRPPMSPPIRSPSDRKKSGDVQGRERRRERSGDKAPEVRVAKASEARSPVDAKSGKIPETRIPKSPETRLVRSADGKFAAKTPEGRGLRSTDGKFAKTPEGRGSRSLSAENSRSSDSKTSPVSESRRRRPSAPERTRQLSGASVATKSPEVIPEVPVAGPPIDADSKERKVGDKEPVNGN